MPSPDKADGKLDRSKPCYRKPLFSPDILGNSTVVDLMGKLSAMPHKLEHAMEEQRITQVIYLKAPVAQVWEALTNPDVTVKYWGGTRIESDWRPGSRIRYVRGGEVVDEHTIIAIEPPVRLVHTFEPLFGEFRHEQPSQVSIELQEAGEVTRLALVHDHFQPDSKVFRACSEGWPMILGGLKAMLESEET